MPHSAIHCWSFGIDWLSSAITKKPASSHIPQSQHNPKEIGRTMKQLKRKKLAGALVQALGAGVALSVVVTGAMAQQAQKVEKIEVTGSNIKRVDTETVAPVEIITREEIERTGQATVADVIRNIPANTGGSFGESFSNSFASGASGVSLRGLGQKTTLVLLNGR